MPESPGHTSEQSTQTYLSKVGSNLLDSIVRRFSNPVTARRNRVLLLLVTAGLLTLILLPSQHLVTARYKPGEIATSDIRASQDYLLEDHELTKQLRSEAEAKAPVVYTAGETVATTLLNSITRAMNATRNARSENPAITTAELRPLLEPVLEAQLAEGELRSLLKVTNQPPVLSSLKQILDELYKQKIILDEKVFRSDIQRGIEICSTTGKSIGTATMATPFIEIGEARRLLQSKRLDGVTADVSRHLLALTAKILKPNLFFDREATEARKRGLLNDVKPVLYKIQKGEMIVRVGERVSSEQSHKLQMIYEASRGEGTLYTVLGIFGLALVLFYFPYRFACKNIRKFNPSNRDLLAIAVLIVGSFFVFKLALLISANIGAAFPAVSPASYAYLFPFAAGAMIVRILLNSEVALVYCVMMAPLLGILFNSNMYVVIYALLGSVVGAHGVRQCQDRSVIYTAGLKLAVINLALGLCFQTINSALFTMQTLYVICFTLVGALLSAMLVSAFTPLFESLFHFTTNIKLLELANLNAPLLRDLMIKAPGTYHHSVVVGNLVEAAAEAIGANPLLARVAAYYHDIGKTAKPLYFIENMQGGENRHDKLSPHMSALILISHIKEGEAMARERHLGQPIIDVIRQHHGTALIKFFYEKAKTQADATGQQVDPQEFRYPGPKPQTREAGLVMLADAVEAASRTLVNPTPDRIQGMVQKLINRIFSDGQLDECELTLKNLHEIAKSFNRILGAIFHHRIDYPEPAHKGGIGGKKSNAHSGTEQPAKTPGPVAPHQGSSSEDLKRLGMS
ncbi:HDIG domain-containing protein [Trichlorobacter lovleyi]|uniref:HD family phosphohydrolase n=1 Tax=Trichlorobacter lovleyi TaxID=313985 RepID=UPI00223F1EE9|nr:HDIG domain-containing metalloprotein [Trichlorobacter lovleyi]QOX79688.1 HDIG domain-containing protein [Trichlorobacter lovleyi]